MMFYHRGFMLSNYLVNLVAQSSVIFKIGSRENQCSTLMVTFTITATVNKCFLKLLQYESAFERIIEQQI